MTATRERGEVGSAHEFRLPGRLRDVRRSEIRRLHDLAPLGSINFGLGDPDLNPPEAVRLAGARIAREGRNGYTPQAGLITLRTLIASATGDPDPTRVVVTAGSQEALFLALMSLVDDGDEVLVPDPGFMAYPTLVRMAGGTPVPYRLPAARGFAFDESDFRGRIGPRTRAVVCASPSNPTGRTLDCRDLLAMSAALRGTGIYVVSDEVYREVYFSASRPESIADYYDRTVVVNSLSKSASMTGWRVGWLVGPRDVADAALLLHGYVMTCAPTISQKAAVDAWESLVRSSDVPRRVYRERRDVLLGHVERDLGLRAHCPDGAFYTMVDVSAYGKSLDVAEAFLGHGVITVPGSAFGDEGEGFLRLSFCCDVGTIEEGVRRLKSALAELVVGCP